MGKGLAKSPIPPHLAAALQSAEVNLSDVVPSGFQLVFGTRPLRESGDYDLMGEALLTEFNRVVLEIIVDGKPKLLMDGFITQKDLDKTEGKVVVTGEDVSVKMDLIEVSKAYPEKTDSAMVNEILDRYKVLIEEKVVEPPENEVTPVKHNPQQHRTDRQFLLWLAKRNDRRFYVKFGKKAIAYWGPRETQGKPQPALISNTLMFSNVERLSPRYDSMHAVLHYGAKLGDGDGGKESTEKRFGAAKFAGVALSKVPAPLKDFAALATDPESFEKQLSTLKVRGKYIRHQELNASRVGSKAQSATDRKAGQVAMIEGELDTARYGYVLETPGIVGVRGAGASFDGDYYVQSVTHKMSFRSGEVKYMQSFKLMREGIGSLKQTVST